jgi:Leucine-rich repeat (LRR) protein
LSCLTSLKKLSVQSNRLAAISGLAQCAALEELTLSHNGISAIQASRLMFGGWRVP